MTMNYQTMPNQNIQTTEIRAILESIWKYPACPYKKMKLEAQIDKAEKQITAHYDRITAGTANLPETA